jgi:two-component system invasion response regulator UvrY
MKTTILIADDHTLVRETWSFILNNHPNYSVIGEAGNAEAAIEKAKLLHPDIILMDINLPGMNGIDATEVIRKESPLSKVLGVSLHVQPSYAKKIMKNGAMGYVTKNSSSQEMFDAIENIQQGKKYICKEIKEALADQMLHDDNAGSAILTLSKRELEVIGYIRKGFSSKEMAEVLFLSIKTIEVHRYNILKKLNLKNSAALVNFINNSELGLVA